MKFVGINCPVCSEKFSEDDDIVVCPKCGAPYHRECYQKNGKCIFTELHKNKQLWINENPLPEENISEEKTEKQEFIICNICGTKNPPDALICQKCGINLSHDNYIKIPDFLKFDDENNDEDFYHDANEENKEENNNLPVGVRFVSFSNLAKFKHIKKDTNFDGVTGEELCNYVGNSIHYYLPVFSDIKLFKRSRFHISAFLFGGLWYFFRKQYKKGIIISLIEFILNAVFMITDKLYSQPIFEKAKEAISSSFENGHHDPSYEEYIQWIRDNESFQNMLLAFMPYIISLILFIIMITIGINANKGYYKHCIKNIKKLKNDPSFPQNSQEQKLYLQQKGNISLKAIYFYGLAYILFNAVLNYILLL